jgi:6-phospho-3-hexuloisomerase
MTTYDGVRTILAELDRVLARVDEAQVDAFCAAILGARRIVAYAMGRENLVLRSFVMRLMHLGLDVAMAGDITAPPVGPGDVFLSVCGPGYISTTAGLMGVAHQAGAQIVMITAQPQTELMRQADVLLVIPAQTLIPKAPARARPWARPSSRARGFCSMRWYRACRPHVARLPTTCVHATRILSEHQWNARGYAASLARCIPAFVMFAPCEPLLDQNRVG